MNDREIARALNHMTDSELPKEETREIMEKLAVYLKEKRNAPGPLEILQKWERRLGNETKK
jgi:hypothetical protein